MSMAKELVERGERDVVAEYLDLCAVFWDDSCRVAVNGEASFTLWKRDIAEGRTPDFSMQLR